jgi:hypothetical protein
MKNRHSKSSHISEARFREVISFFAADLPSLTAAELTGLNYRTIHRIYSLMRERLVELAFQEMQPLTGDIEVDAVTDAKQRPGKQSYFGARRVRGKRGRGSPIFPSKGHRGDEWYDSSFRRVWLYLRQVYPTQMPSKLIEIHAQKSSRFFHICFSLMIRYLYIINLSSAT